MRIALTGDVHGNLPALESILEHARSLDCEQVWNIGDFVGYGPFPEEVVSRFKDIGATSILGNYDLKVLRMPQRSAEWRKKKDPTKLLAFQWAYDHLSADNLAYLSSLPEERRMEIQGWRVLLTHASPASHKEHLSPATPPERLAEHAAVADADLVVFGHSHQPFVRKVSRTWFINTGSVGRPDDGDPRACYAMLYLEQAEIGVCHFRVPYDIEKCTNEIKRAGLPIEFAQMIETGRNLDAVTTPT